MPFGEKYRYPEKVQAAETNASAACCSPQNSYKITLSFARRKGFFNEIVVKSAQLAQPQGNGWRKIS